MEQKKKENAENGKNNIKSLTKKEIMLKNEYFMCIRTYIFHHLYSGGILFLSREIRGVVVNLQDCDALVKRVRTPVTLLRSF